MHCTYRAVAKITTCK